MRSDALVAFKDTFDTYKRVGTQDPVSGEMVIGYELDETGAKGRLIPQSNGQLVLVTRDPVDQYSALRNVRDRAGNPTFVESGEEYDMYVIDVLPQYDAFGIIVAWRHTIKRSLPREVTGGTNHT